MPTLEVGAGIKSKPMSRAENETKKEWQKTANKRRTRALLETTWSQIIAIYDDKPIFVHMVNILRSKGAIAGYREEEEVVNGKLVKTKVPIYRDPYYIDDEEALKIMEAYREELDVDALDSARLDLED